MVSSERLGWRCWVLEPTIAWLLAFPRLAIRHDRSAMMKQRILLLVIAGVLAWPAGVVLGELVHPWSEEILPRLGTGLLVAAAVLGYRLKKSRSSGIDPDSSPGR